MLQEDLLGTKDEIGSSNVHLYNSDLHLDLVPQDNPGHGTRIARGERYFYMWYIFNLVPQEILVMAPELQEDWISTLTGNVDIPLPGAARINPGHGTRIARGERWYNYYQYKSVS